MRKPLFLATLLAIFCGIALWGNPAQAQTASGSEIRVMGFKATLDNYEVVSQNGNLTFKGKGSLDLSPALGTGAVISSDEITIDSAGNASFKNITTPEFKIGALTAQVAPGDIEIKSQEGLSQTLNLNVTLKLNIGDQTLQVLAAIPVTKDGISDAVIELKPPAGQDNFFFKQFNDVSLALKSGKLEFKDKSFSNFTFTGALNLMGTDLQLKQVSVTDSGITGHAEGSLNLSYISMAFTEGVDFTYDKTSGFKVTVGKAGIDLSKLIPGAGTITINQMSFADGKFHADTTLQQTISVGGASLSLERVVIDSEKRSDNKPYIKANINGAVSLAQPKVDIKFTGLEIDSDGNLKSDIKLEQPQTISLFGAGLTVESVSLKKQTSGTLDFSLAGEFALGSDKLKFSELGLLEGKVNGKFGVSKDTPFSFSWFPYLKVTQLEISKGELVFGGQIDTPDPVKYTFSFQDIKFDMNGDIKKTVVSGAQNAWDKLSDPALISVVNTNTTPLTVSGFSFYLNAITIPNPLAAIKNKSFPDTLLKLYMKAEIPLSGKKITFNVDGLEITKSGLKDLSLDIAPPSGQDSFFSQDFGGVASVSLKKVMLVVKDKKFQTFSFAGALSITNPKVVADITSITVTADGKVTGEASFSQAPISLSLAGLGVSITGVKFSTAGTSDVSVNLAGSVKLGSDTLNVSSLTIDKTGVTAKFDISKDKPFSFSWFTYLKVTQFEINKNELVFGGRIDIPDPVKYTFSFQDIKFDMNGNIKKAVVSGAQNAWDKLSDPALISVVNTNTTPLTVSGFSFYLNAITIPNPLAAIKNKSFPDTLLKLYMKAEIPLSGKKITFNVEGLEITKSGLKDLTLDIAPPSGQDSFFSQDFGGVASVSIKKVKLVVKDKKFQTFSFAGALSITNPKVVADITSITVTADGKVTGEASFSQAPISLSLAGLGVSITSVKFSAAGTSDVSVNLSGSVKLGNDTLNVSSLLIDKTGVTAKFDVSKDKPFAFSWFSYLKVTQLEINKSELIFGGRVDTPDPVKYTFSFQDVKFDMNGDLKKAAASGAQKAWEKVTSTTLLSVVNTNTTPLTIGGFSFYIDAITVPNPFAAVKNKALPDTLLSLYMRCELPLGSEKITVNVDGLEITKSGLKDLTLNVAPPQGKTSLYSVTFSNWVEFRIDGAKLVVKSGKFESFSFTGGIKVDGNGFNITTLTIKDGAMSGALKPTGDPSLKLGGIKLAFGGDITFKVAAGAQKSSAGGGGPPANITSPFSISFKKVTLDLTEILGNSSAKVTFDELSYADGNIRTEIKTPASFDLAGLKLGINYFLLESKMPAQGKSRTFDLSLDGNFKFFDNKISLDFKQFKISSSGDISGIIKPPVAQSFDLYIMSFTVSQITIGKKSGQPFELALAGSFSIAKGPQITFDSLKYSNGKVSFLVTRPDNNAIALPVCDFVKITKFEIADNKLTLTGFMDVPVLNFRLVAQDITVSTDGGVTGGVFKLGSEAKINLGALTLTISTASFDLKTKYLKYSGKLSLPSDIFSGSFDFQDMGLQLASSNNVTQDTSKTKITAPANAEDKKHGFPIKITSTNFGFKDNKFVFSMSGTMTYMGKFTLNFENLSIAVSPTNVKDVSFGIGKVTGSIKLSAFSLEITDFQIKDQDSDPSVLISGGLQLPQFGCVKVQGLQIYKSGKITLEGVEIKMDKGAYKVGAKISYKDETFNGAGTITFGDKTLNVSVMFSKTEFKFEISVSGLNIVLFPGITLDGVGGGIHCKYDPLWMEFKLSADIGLGSGKLVKGRVTLIFNTSGVISITGELFIADTLKLGEANITADIPNKTVTGYAKVNAALASIVNLNFQVNLYYSPSDWYVRGSGGASIASVSLGSVNLDVSSKGFYLKGSYGYSASIFSATLSFEFNVVSANNISLRLTGKGSVDLAILSVSVSIDFKASYSNGEFNGSVGVSGCIHIALWVPVTDTCYTWGGCPCCCCFWPGWDSHCFRIPYPCNWRMEDHGGDVCKSATLHIRVNKSGISAWL